MTLKMPLEMLVGFRSEKQATGQFKPGFVKKYLFQKDTRAQVWFEDPNLQHSAVIGTILNPIRIIFLG